MNIDSIAIEAATDGACSGNPGPGGWGGLIIFDDKSELEIGGSEQNTTNNRMELTAAIKTLEKLKTFKLKETFKLRTDSKYVIEGYTKWIINWKRNGWKTSSGKSVQNLDLWQKIDQLRINGLVMEYVKGHSGDKQNDRVDKIATNYSKGISLENKLIVDKLVSQGWYLPFNSDYLQSKYKTEMLPISGPSKKCWENSWSFPVLTNEQKINLKNIWNEYLSP